MAPQENLARRETEACQGSRVHLGLKEMRVWAAHVVPTAHWDPLDCQVQLVRKDRRGNRVLLVPEETQALLDPQEPQDPLPQ